MRSGCGPEKKGPGHPFSEGGPRLAQSEFSGRADDDNTTSCFEESLPKVNEPVTSKRRVKARLLITGVSTHGPQNYLPGASMRGHPSCHMWRVKARVDILPSGQFARHDG